MTLTEYAEVLGKRWRCIVAGLVLGLVIAASAVLLTPRQYSAEVTMIVTTQVAAGDTAGAIDAESLAAQRVRTYVELLRSRQLAADVVESLGLPITPEQLEEQITASTVPDTKLITATVTDGSPDGAVEIATVVGEQFIDNVADLERPDDATLAPLVAAELFEKAAPPAGLVAPRPLLYLVFGLLLGLLAGFGVAVLRNALDGSITSRRQLEEILDAPVLGEFTHDRKVGRTPPLVVGHRYSPLAESFRQLRTNVSFVDVDRAHKVILVTSASAAEGKSSTAYNLALALAEAGRRVLVVDADLRRVATSAPLGVDGVVGLTEVVGGRVPLSRAVQPAGPALDVLTSGLLPTNPSELLGSARMGRLLMQLRELYDVVLLDASALLPVTDAAVLARQADGTVLVVRHGRTSVQDAEAARDALDAVSGRILGSVLAMTPASGRRRHPVHGRPARAVDTESAKRPDREATVQDGRPVAPSPSPRPRLAATSKPDDQQLGRQTAQ